MSDAAPRGLVEDLLAASLDGVALLEGDGHERVNEAYATAFGAESADALVGSPWRHRFPPPVRDRIETLSGSADGAAVTVRGGTCRRTDGSTFTADVRVRGTADGAVVVVRDRSPESEHGASVESDPGGGRDGDYEGSPEGDDRYGQLVDAAPVPIGVVTADGVLAYCNRAAAEFHGAASPSELVGRSALELMAEDVPTDAARERLRRVVEDGAVVYAVERRFQQLDGTERVGVVSLAPTVHAGEPAAQVVINDVTDRKRRERRWRTLVSHFPNGAVVMFDEDLRFTVAGGEALHDLEVPSGSVEGSTVDEAFEEPLSSRLAAGFETALDGETTVFDVEYRDRVWTVRVVPVRDEAGEVFAGMAMSQDVTEQRERERELRRQERRYRVLAERIPDLAVALFTEEGDDLRYSLVAGSAFDGLPLDPADLEGELFTEAHSEQYVETHFERYRAALDGESRTFEFTFDDRFYEAYTLPFRDEEGRIVSGMAVTRDVTDRVERERALRRQERRYRTLAEHIPDGAVALFERDDDGELRYTLMEGPIFDEIDQDRGEAEGLRLREYHSDWFVEEFLHHHEAAMEGETSTFQYTSFDRIFRAHTLPVTDDDGEVVSGMVMAQDVTEREERQRRLETLIDNLPGIAYRCRNERGWPMEFVGGECEKITGYSPADLEDGDVVWGRDVIHPEDREAAWEAVQESLDADEPFELTYRIRTADGETRWMWERGQGVYDSEGEVTALEGFITDVTERRENERELERRRDELETLNGINRLLLNTTRALSEAPTREEVESTVCERLAASDLYRFAWIGERGIGDEAVVPRTSAGDDDYLAAVSPPDGDAVSARGLAARAMRAGEVRVVRDVGDTGVSESREENSGNRSAAAVPLVHGGTVYGVLVVYSERPDAFSQREQSAFAILGETIGFVLNAIQNRQLLVADGVTELTVESSDPDTLLVAASERLDATLSLAGHAETADDDWLVYLSVEDGDPEALVASLLERDRIVDAWVIEATEDGGQVGFRDEDPEFVRTVLSAGPPSRRRRRPTARSGRCWRCPTRRTSGTSSTCWGSGTRRWNWSPSANWTGRSGPPRSSARAWRNA